MTNAILPTLQTLNLLGGLVKIYVDQYSSVKSLSGSLATANTTSYSAFTNILNNTSYQVPVSTNLRIWGIDKYISLINAGITVMQLGYADNTSGTNFVSLLDLIALANALGAAGTYNNIITGLLTVPANKYPILKQTANGGWETFTINLTALETN